MKIYVMHYFEYAEYNDYVTYVENNARYFSTREKAVEFAKKENLNSEFINAMEKVKKYSSEYHFKKKALKKYEYVYSYYKFEIAEVE